MKLRACAEPLRCMARPWHCPGASCPSSTRRSLPGRLRTLPVVVALVVAAWAGSQLLCFLHAAHRPSQTGLPLASWRHWCLPGRAAPLREVRAAAQTHSSLIPTAKAPFLNAKDQPVLLNQNGTRSARFELLVEGMAVTVEPAPSFGAQSASAGGTEPDETQRYLVIPRKELGYKNLRDLFWLEDGRFLITGYDVRRGRFSGWVTDQVASNPITIPTPESSLFLPASPTGSPIVRKDEQGSPEVLVGFVQPDADGQIEINWNWYSVGAKDLVDAATDEGLPTSLWREVIVSNTGIIEAVLLINGTVCRRTPDGWKDVGLLQLVSEEGEKEFYASVTSKALQPRQHLISLAPDFGVVAIDLLSSDSGEPRNFADVSSYQDKEADASWVLSQCVSRGTSALVQITADGAPPIPLFAHPYADITAEGVWLNPETQSIEAVMVNDLDARAYGLLPAQDELLESMRQSLPSEVVLSNISLTTEDMEPLYVERHGERWLVYYSHPLLAEPVVLPAVKKKSSATIDWLGDQALPARAGALNAEAATLQPVVETHRIPSGQIDIPVYIVLPPQGSAALVVRLHDGPGQRDSRGADEIDAWLLSRGYGVLKVNYRGSSGFGRSWQKASNGGFLDDVATAIRWALEKRRIFGEAYKADGAQPPVAVMGTYFGGYAAIHAIAALGDLVACSVAVAPLQLPRPPHQIWWPQSHAPNAEARARMASARGDLTVEACYQGMKDPASNVLSPSSLAKDLQGAAVMVVEYERDRPEARGEFLSCLASPGCSPETWPTNLHYVQYADEVQGGGAVRQSMLDLYRRMDTFLHSQLRHLVLEGNGKLRRERFVYEVPFLSASLQPSAMRGQLSQTADSLELVFEDMFRKAYGDEAARELPALRSASLKGFKAKPSLEDIQDGERSNLAVPANRISVREDGTMEFIVKFPEEPKGLHLLLSEVWLHIRAEGVGLTLTLPRQPNKTEDIHAFHLPGGTSVMFEIAGDPDVGALQNYNNWAAQGNRPSLLGVLRPKDLEAASVIVVESEPANQVQQEASVIEIETEPEIQEATVIVEDSETDLEDESLADMVQAEDETLAASVHGDKNDVKDFLKNI